MVQAVRSRIEQTNEQFMAAINRGDTSAVAALYTVDAVILPPNAETVRGRDGAKALFDGMIQQMGVPTLTLSTVEVTEVGDAAYEVGAYTMRLQPPGAAVVDDSGKYVVVWKCQGDGAWKLAVDIWNTDLPMPGA
jgi:uncharacterized protein (TIGR02246 family)